jgi:hypothetical protein
MSIGNLQIGSYIRRTASGNVKNTSGALLGFYVASTTTGTIQFYDDAATGTATPISGVITPAVGWNTLPIAYAAGLNAVIGGTALDVTIVIA